MQPVRTSLDSLLDPGRDQSVEGWLHDVADPLERAEELAGLDTEHTHRLPSALGPQGAARLADSVDRHTAGEFLGRLDGAETIQILKAMRPDRAAGILREMPAPLVVELLARMGGEPAAVLRSVLSRPHGSAGAHMTPVSVSLSVNTPAGEAIEQVRSSAAGGAATTYLFVTDDDQVLRGVVPFRGLVLSPPERPVGDQMVTDVVSVSPSDDREEAARLLHAHGLAALPVVDEGRIIGVIPADGVADIAEEEATEDAAWQGGSVPLEVPYLHASPWTLWKKRILWLLVLFFASAYTGTVLSHFEAELESVIALAFFIPLLIGTGGNTGTQITTTLVRAIAVGEVGLRDIGRVVRKEMSTGLLVALAMASVAMVRAWVLGVGPQVTLIVVLTIAAIILCSALVAAILPLVLQRLGLDPAVVSSPFIATLVDGTGLIIYFEIARLVLW